MILRALAASTLIVAPASGALLTEPWVAVVTKDQVPLRSGPATLHYPIATLKVGTALRAEVDENGFVRVQYPAGMRAYVGADEVQADATGKVVKLLRPSRLKAANAAGERYSWYPLLDKDLDAGTELKVVEAVKGDDGKVTKYAVAAPPQARAFVSSDLLRRATPEEAAAFDNPGAGTPPAAPASATPPAAPAGTTTPAGSASVPNAETPGGSPAPTQPAAPAASSPAAATPPSVTPPPPPAPPKESPIDALVRLFNTVRAQPEAEAETAAVIAEFQKYQATLTDSPGDQRTRRYLQRFVDFLNVQRGIQDEKRRQAEANKTLDAAASAMREQIIQLEKQAIYTAIGRLTTSAVYDGTRLPKLYRIVSPEPGSARTVGYLKPDPSLDLDGKIGRIIGVVGESRLDEALKATMITPMRVDIVSLAAVVTSSPGGGSRPVAPSGTPVPAAPATPATQPAAPPAAQPGDDRMLPPIKGDR
jgi:hypothetical protein